MKLIHHPTLRLDPLFYDDFLTKNLLKPDARPTSDKAPIFPAANIISTHDDFRIEMAVPGLRKHDFTIKLENDLLLVSSSQQETSGLQAGSKYVKQEFQQVSFEWRFRLPKALIVPNDIRAEYHDGILQITIPKKEEAKELPPRQIEIN